MTWAVKFEDVSKHYRGGGPRYGSLRHDVTQGFKRLGRLFSRRHAESRGALALDRVSFEVCQSDSFAIIGPNGAGKTTALRIISRITYPTGGRVRVRGRVGALIEVGSGVHPELSARENIWLYGQILGMSKDGIRRRFDEIVEFAELSDAVDTPVKMYSSGMQLRLGFAIASHLEPDIFVVDEALAVGDAGFQAKCVEWMTKLLADGRSLIFVSHNLSAVEAVCRRGLFLLDGRVRCEGDTSTVLRSYLDWVDERQQARHLSTRIARPSKYLVLQRMTCHGGDGTESYAFRTGEDLEVRLHFRALAPVRSPYVSLGITDGRPGNLVLCSMLVDGAAPAKLDGESVVSCRLRSLPLLPRVYQLWCSVRSEQAYGDVLDWQQVGTFRIAGATRLVGPAAHAHTSTDGPVHVAHEWQVTTCP